MVVKILNSSSSDFNGVRYNERKMKQGKGVLMLMKNFPSFINEQSKEEDVKNYLKAVSGNKRVKNPQFHAVISTKFQSHSKEELTKIAEEFMKEMGYEKQPYLVVFHSDTANNHVHIVSTRVDKDTGKKIKDSYEKLKSQRAMDTVMKRLYGEERRSDLEALLEYKFSTLSQLEKLLEQNGYQLVQEQEKIKIIAEGRVERELSINDLNYQSDSNRSKKSRAVQLRAILNKYKEVYSNKVFKVVDDSDKKQWSKEYKEKWSYESELQHQMRVRFGVDIVFHQAEGKLPFGFSVIDHATQQVFKGSEVMKMKELFEFTSDEISKRDFEHLKAYPLRGEKEKQILLSFLQREGKQVKDFMLFTSSPNRRISKEDFARMRKEVRDYMKEPKQNGWVHIEKDENGVSYVIHEKYHQIHELDYVLGENQQEWQKKDNTIEIGKEVMKWAGTLTSTVSELMTSFGKSAYIAKEPTERDLKKRKKKKRK